MNIPNILNYKKPIKWLFYGDSITQGSLHTSGQRCYSELFAERVRYELSRPMDIVINTAFSGHTTRNLLESFDWRVANLKPDIVFIMIGMNDCNKSNGINLEEFEANIVKLLSLVDSINATPILQTTCPTLINVTGYKDYLSLSLYMDVIRRIAFDKNATLIDHMSFWNKNADYHSQWMNNLVHPNGFGHRVFARYIFQCMGIFNDTAPSCKLPIL